MKRPSKTTSLAGLLVATALITACGNSDSSSEVAADSDATFTLQLLHFADMDGSDTTAMASVASMSALIEKFRGELPDSTLVVSSGDNYIPGPRFNAASDSSLSSAQLLGTAGAGRADIAFLNAMGVQAAALGNHELDLGPASFANIIGADEQWPGANFPYLAFNVNFSADADTAALVKPNGQTASTAAGSVTGWVTTEIGDQTIGIIGASSPSFPTITSVGDLVFRPNQNNSNAVEINALADELQRGVDEMIAVGINKIVMLSHMQQIEIEKQLATRLRGVDIIVAGGSNTILADNNDQLRAGESAADTYPIELQSASGEPVVVVNTGPDYKYLGRFIAPFNGSGTLVPGAFDSALSGAVATTEGSDTAQGVTATGRVLASRDAVNNVLIAKDGNVSGYTAVFLEGRRSVVRNQEANLGNLTADANLWFARQAGQTAQISLKNGGGIRAEIGRVIAPPGSTSAEQVQLLPPAANPVTGRAEYGVSQLAIETALRFNNKLWVFDITAEQLKSLLEHAVSSLGSRGQFPQVGGMSFSYDPAREPQIVTEGAITQAGARVRSLRVADELIVSDGQYSSTRNAPSKWSLSTFWLVGATAILFPTHCQISLRLKKLGWQRATVLLPTRAVNRMPWRSTWPTFMQRLKWLTLKRKLMR